MARLAVAAERDEKSTAIDISYDELTADPVEAPIAVVRRLYDRFGYAYSPAFEAAMVRHLEAQRAVERPRHAYALDQFGLSRAQVLERAGDYLDWVSTRCGQLGR
jgi:hypothetical protein